jgi:CheY-like chemotaxis protein
MLVVKQKLLLVDDSKEDRFLMKQSLADCGLDCEVEEVCDGEAAELHLTKCIHDNSLPHVVILDLILPKRSGIEFGEFVRLRTRTTYKNHCAFIHTPGSRECAITKIGSMAHL